MNKYDKYKDSGFDWIGEIPEHWEFEKLRYFISENDGGVWGKGNGNITVMRSTEINIDGSWNFNNEPAKRKLTNTEYDKALLLKGDLVITKSSGSELHIGKTALVNDKVAKMKCCFSNFMQRIRLKEKQNPTLYFYLLNSILAREQYNYLSNTTTGLVNLGAELISNISFPIPPKPEQTAIADYLTRKTAEIDSLIAKKEKLLQLYEEEKTAIINRAVTKGINPDAAMKDSSIDWLGEIPEHWEVKRVATFGSFSKGKGIPRSELTDNGFPAVLYGDIYTKYNIKADVIKNHINEETAKTSVAIQKGDLLFRVCSKTCIRT